MPNAKIGFSKAMSAGWLTIDKNAEGGARVFRKVSDIGIRGWHLFSCVLISMTFVSMAFIQLCTSKHDIRSVAY